MQSRRVLGSLLRLISWVFGKGNISGDRGGFLEQYQKMSDTSEETGHPGRSGKPKCDKCRKLKQKVLSLISLFAFLTMVVHLGH